MADSVRGPTLLELRDLVQAGIQFCPEIPLSSLGAGGHQQHGLHLRPQVGGQPRRHPGHRPLAGQMQAQRWLPLLCHRLPLDEVKI